MADLIGKRDIVRMRRPGRARVLAGGGIHGMESIRRGRAGLRMRRIGIRIKVDVSEAIDHAGRH